MVLEQVYNNYAREASLADDAMFWKESLRGVKKQARGLGGAQPPPTPPICTHDVFITGSERGHMGSVFAGRMILDVALYSLKKCGVWGRRRPPNLQTDCLQDGTISKRPRNRVSKTQRTQGPEDRDHGTRGPRDQRTKRPGTWPNLLNPNVGCTFLKKNLDPRTTIYTHHKRSPVLFPFVGKASRSACTTWHVDELSCRIKTIPAQAPERLGMPVCCQVVHSSSYRATFRCQTPQSARAGPDPY